MLWAMLHMVALTVMTYVPGGVAFCPPADPPPPPPGEPPLADTPHPVNPIISIARSSSASPVRRLRRRPIHVSGASRANSGAMRFPPDLSSDADDAEHPVAMEMFTLELLEPERATLVGLTTHVAFFGTPEQASATVPEVPATPVS